jgi:hypothetical protein
MVAADEAQLHQADRLLELPILAAAVVAQQALTVKQAAQELLS